MRARLSDDECQAGGDAARFVGLEAIWAVGNRAGEVTATSPNKQHQVADPDELRRRLSDAGLRNVTVDSSHEERIEVRSGQQLWNWTVGSNPIPGQLLAGLTEEQRTDVVRVLDGMIASALTETGRLSSQRR